MTRPESLPFVLRAAGLVLHSPAKSETEIPELLVAALDELLGEPLPEPIGTYKIFAAMPDRERPGDESNDGNDGFPTFFGLLEHSIGNRLCARPSSSMPFYGDYAGVQAVEEAIVEMDKDPTLHAVLLLAADCHLDAAQGTGANVGAAVLLTQTGAATMHTRVLAIRNIVGSVVGDAVQGFSRAIKRVGWALSIDIDGVQHVIVATPPHGVSEDDLRQATSEACASRKYTGKIHKPSAECGSFGAATGVYELAFASHLLRAADHGTHCLWVARTPDSALAMMLGNTQPKGGAAR